MTDDKYDVPSLFEILRFAESSEAEGPPIRSVDDIFEASFLKEFRARLAERPETVHDLLRGPWRVFERFSDEEGEHWVVVRTTDDPLTASPAGIFKDRVRAYVLAALLSALQEMPVHKLEKDGDMWAILEQTPDGWKTIGHVREKNENALRAFRMLCGISRSQQALAQIAEGVGRQASTPTGRSLKDDQEKPS